MTTLEHRGSPQIENRRKKTVIRRRGNERKIQRVYGVLDNPSVQFEKELTEKESIILQLAIVEKNKSEKEAVENMRLFEGSHSDGKIQNNITKLLELRKEQQKSEENQKSNDAKDLAKERAIIAEYLFYNFASDSKFFGENSFVTKTSEFDDRMHHADGIVTWFDSKGVDTAHLAFDVTISSNEEVLSKKEKYLARDIESGMLTTIDYFDSQSVETYALKRIPRIIIMLTPENIIAMCDKAVEAINSDEVEFDSLSNDDSIREFMKRKKYELVKQNELLHKAIGGGNPRKNMLIKEAILNTEAVIKEM